MGDFEDRPPLPDDWTREHVDALRVAARRNDAAALAQLGDMYRDGWRRSDGTVLVRRDLKAAKRCLERAAALGDAEAMYVLAGVLVDGHRDARCWRSPRTAEIWTGRFRPTSSGVTASAC